MSKVRANTTIVKKFVLVCVVALIALLPGDVAYANAASPPSVVWFTFDYKTAQIPKLVGIQLIGCETTNCGRAVLLQQYGTCDGVGCLALPATLTVKPNDFGCAGNKCRSAAFPSHGGTDFRLVVQFSDRIRISEVISKLPSSFVEDTAWRVVVQGTDLSMQPDTIPVVPDPYVLNIQHLLGRLGLSIVVELLVAGLCFQIWSNTDRRRLMGRLLIILLVNLVTLPVVWFFFPSLGQFQSDASHKLGIFVLIVAVSYADLLIGIYRSVHKIRRWLIILTLISLPIIGVCSLVLYILVSYGNSAVIAQGLSFNLTLFASEVFAVAFEAILIAILSKRSLPFGLICVTSLLMNAASFFLGQLLFM